MMSPSINRKDMVFLFLTLFTLSIILLPLICRSGSCETGGSIYEIYRSFHMICHQQPERSYCISAYSGVPDITSCSNLRMTGPYTFVSGSGRLYHQFPVCARCLGFYLFFWLGYLTTYGYVRRLPSMRTFVLLILPLAVDGTGQLIGLWTSSNPIRFITGMLAGVVSGIFLGLMMEGIPRTETGR